MVDAIEYLARALHPEAFTSLAAPAADSNPIISDPKIEEARACDR
jgi:hypothetical protein